MAKWYSEDMKEHHTKARTDTYVVYHIKYLGKAKGWNPKSVRWGYVGIAPYDNIEDVYKRYVIEREEIRLGKRKSKRKVMQMIEEFADDGLIGVSLLADNLTREEALDMEAFLRPKGYDCYFDQRIWNAAEGGVDFND